jgi:hypothetical protein
LFSAIQPLNLRSQMRTVTGRLSSTGGDPLEGYQVVLTFQQKVSLDGGEAVLTGASQSSRSGKDGGFRFEIPEADEAEGPFVLRVVAPTGEELVRRELKKSELKEELALEVEPVRTFAITPADGEVLEPQRLTGRVIDARGEHVPSGLPVVIWGRRRQENGDGHVPAEPLLATTTALDGYFGGSRSLAALEESWGTVAGGEPVPVPVEEGRLPTRVVLVVTLPDAATEEAECECEVVPPRAPDQADLTDNPRAFSDDLGGSCVDLSAPNRVLEEFSYLTVVRTTDPEVRGTTLGSDEPLPDKVVRDLLEIAGEDLELIRRKLGARGLKLRPDVLSRILRGTPDALDLDSLRDAALSGELERTEAEVRALASPAPQRLPLDANRAIDWDETPTIHQATTISHGHVLEFRQIWRADGYSLGDLLYSLPLAPAQKRRIAVLEWNRRERGARVEALESEERLEALLSRDRDVSEIVSSHLRETQQGGSETSTWAAGGGIGGGFLDGAFGIFGGVAGGGSGSSATSWQDSGRSLAGSFQQQIRDRTSQSAVAVREQRSSVVQAVAQGESVQAQTEMVVNHNHCHAMTVEYFEVLRHLQVSEELVDVRECLFVPLSMAPFDRRKAGRWRDTLRRTLLDQRLAKAFPALERVLHNWEGFDVPSNSYAEEAPEVLDGELRISFVLPRPRDGADGAFQVSAWEPYQQWLWMAPVELWAAQLAERSQAQRDAVFRRDVAPRIAERIVQSLRFSYVTGGGAETVVPLDATLVSRYEDSVPLYVTLRPAGGSLPAVPRGEIVGFRISYEGDDLPADAQVVVSNGRVRYETPHLRHLLFDAPRLANDLHPGDPVYVPTPLSREEMRNPRREDVELVDQLLAHLNEHVEHYHQAIWARMDPNRRYMLLDGIIAPNSGGRSVASVVENRLIGIVGNSMVLPVAPGNHLDPSFRQDIEEPVNLINHYATDPPPPTRISLPTSGVYAEAVMDQCSSCEKKDDTRLWRWDESEIPEDAPAIEPLSTESRAEETPDLTPTPLPQPIVNVQNAPELPDPVGLRDAFSILSRSDLFKDVTGLKGSQEAALAAFQQVMSTSQQLGSQAARLAQQQALGRSIDRTLAQIEQAREDGTLSQEEAEQLAASALRGLIGEPRPPEQAPGDDPAVSQALDAASQSERADVRVSTPSETVEASFEGEAEDVIGQLAPPFTVDRPPTLEVEVPMTFETFHATTFELQRGTPTRKKADLEAFALFGGGNRVLLGLAATTHRLKPDPASATEMLAPMNLRIVHPAVPEEPGKIAGEGPLPVAVIVHGQHESWKQAGLKKTGRRVAIPGGGGATAEEIEFTGLTDVPNHDGYDYLQEELAAAGIVSVSVDTNYANFFGSMIETRADMVLRAIDELQRLNADPESRYNGRLELTNVALVGHSRGGDAVVRAAIKNSERAERVGVSAVVTIAPTDFTGAGPPGSRNALTSSEATSLLVVYGALDGDVSGRGGASGIGGTGFRHYDRASCEKAMVFLDGCTHNRFNRTWSEDEFGLPPKHPRLRSRPDHEALAKQYIGGWLRLQLKGEATERELFDGTRTNTVGVPASQQWSIGSVVKDVDDFETAEKNSLGGGRTMPATTRIQQVHDVVVSGNALDPNTGHQTAVAHVNATGGAGSLLAFDLDVPPGDADWSGFERLLVNLTRIHDLTSEKTIGKGVHPLLSVELTDAAGNSASVDQSTFYKEGARPTKPFFHRVRTPSGPRNVTLHRLETFPIPLAAFAGVDMESIEHVVVKIDRKVKARVLLDSLKLARN